MAPALLAFMGCGATPERGDTMRFGGLWAGAFTTLLAACSIGCVTEVDTRPIVIPARTGRLTVFWTVEGSTNPSACNAVAADAFELTLFDASGRAFDTIVANCEDFALSVDLPSGTYSADATLIDVADRSASTTIALDGIRVVSGTELTIDTDFPLSSIL
jgi:hypothetical protein